MVYYLGQFRQKYRRDISKALGQFRQKYRRDISKALGQFPAKILPNVPL